MTDVNSTAPDLAAREAGPVAAKRSASDDEQRLVALVELLFFAYRDFVGGPDEILAELGFGRAHHRVLHFVNRQPGMRVADLLGILKITKQSLARVLKHLVDEGYIEQATGPIDRRERRLFPTTRGRELAARLLGLQTQQLGEALAAAGPDGDRAAAAFLAAVIAPSDRSLAEQLVRRALGAASTTGREAT
ncbi:MAG: MarR family transcriptional regulator [Proteobacteria bacterium]|nr:MarR family transcriptional regulator [Pseudomonadota bacterium]